MTLCVVRCVLCVVGLLRGDPVCCVVCCALCVVGLLRGDPVPYGDRHPGAAHPADPAVVPEGHLPPGLGAQGPGPHEGQVRAAWHLHPVAGPGLAGVGFRARV